MQGYPDGSDGEEDHTHLHVGDEPDSPYVGVEGSEETGAATTESVEESPTAEADLYGTPDFDAIGATPFEEELAEVAYNPEIGGCTIRHYNA